MAADTPAPHGAPLLSLQLACWVPPGSRAPRSRGGGFTCLPLVLPGNVPAEAFELTVAAEALHICTVVACRWPVIDNCAHRPRGCGWCTLLSSADMHWLLRQQPHGRSLSAVLDRSPCYLPCRFTSQSLANVCTLPHALLADCSCFVVVQRVVSPRCWPEVGVFKHCSATVYLRGK